MGDYLVRGQGGEGQQVAAGVHADLHIHQHVDFLLLRCEQRWARGAMA